MGELIYLDQRRKRRELCEAGAPPAFFFDVSCPESYLIAERVERILGEVKWIPVAREALGALRSEAELDALRERAQARAVALRLPLMWPEKFPVRSPRALRATLRACELGVGPRFALAASRLCFCGGYDLDDLETLAEAAAASGLPLDDCLAAARDGARDDVLEATAAQLRGSGVTQLPAIRLDGRWFIGTRCLPAAAAAQHEPGAEERPLVPSAVSYLPHR
jgi:2-hydroxychromene-2-carboxylate isomerase